MNDEDRKIADYEREAKAKEEWDHSQRQREKEEHEKMVAHLAQRDQNDSDVQEVARQVGVFCRGLDEADVVHGGFPPYERNTDRSDAVQFFILTEMNRLRGRQEEDRED